MRVRLYPWFCTSLVSSNWNSFTLISVHCFRMNQAWVLHRHKLFYTKRHNEAKGSLKSYMYIYYMAMFLKTFNSHSSLTTILLQVYKILMFTWESKENKNFSSLVTFPWTIWDAVTKIKSQNIWKLFGF